MNPWHISATHNGAAYDIGAEDGGNIALVYGPEHGGPDDFRANALKMAACRELYEAVAAAESWFARAGDPDTWSLYVQMHAALAKAKGK